MSNISKMFQLLTQRPQFVLVITALILQIIFFSVVIMTNTIEVPHTDTTPVLIELTKNHTPITLFFYQYGTHFQGIGYLITSAVLYFFPWEISSLSYLSVSAQVMTSILALLLIYRLFKRLSVTDIFIPMIILSTKAHELHIVIPNISSAVLPIHMIFLTAIILTSQTTWKFLATTILGILIIYTGYGIITLPLFYAILAIFFIKNIDKSYHLRNFLLYSVAAIYLIYTYNPTNDASCLYSVKEAGDYLVFINQMILNYFHIHRFIMPVSPLIILTTSMAIYHAVRATNKKDSSTYTHLTLFLFYGFSTLAAFSTSIGRICFGGDASTAPRYTIFFITAIIATYIDLRRISSRKIGGLPVWLFVIFLVANELFVAPSNIDVIKGYSRSASIWVSCYRETKSISDCSYISGFYPAGVDTSGHVILQNLLLYSEQHNKLFYSKK